MATKQILVLVLILFACRSYANLIVRTTNGTEIEFPSSEIIYVSKYLIIFSFSYFFFLNRNSKFKF
jgi:hypothetical protein